ncbi:accessory Sec system S-layer assembly protein [Paenisporosarcina cavernae]|uniref:Accessory Sec system S-layer assembly protein n=1 Tax=Paenisporosarcina cavernae TaxID=2320858 RepID=A0A385YSF3_9BACL|nr:accessory Sec system S-layer assembly protein [Paenisporosarcina cavernae]AYC28927.1 accessory Sec system S-layer assembly protein [Paenisporosarcina cavernae]
MGLFDLFKKTARSGSDTTINSEEITSSETDTSSAGSIETTLSYHPEWDVPQEQQYVFQFLSNELPALKPNQISLSGIDLEKNEASGDWYVSAFVRSSLPKPLTLDQAELLLLDSTGEIIAAKEFDLAEVGELPACSDRPWTFQFEKSLVEEKEVPTENWSLAFNVQSLIPHRLDLDISWNEALSDDQKEALSALVANLPKLGKQEINITGFQLKQQDSGALAVSVFIRNGNKQHITLEQIPLEVLDANQDLVVRGSFTLDKLEVRANTTKPWTFIFPKEMIQKEAADFSKWTVRVIQN